MLRASAAARYARTWRVQLAPVLLAVDADGGHQRDALLVIVAVLPGQLLQGGSGGSTMRKQV